MIKPLTIADVQQLHKAGQLDEAKAGYLSLLDVNPDDVDALHFLGVICAELGDLDAAQLHLERAININSDDKTLYLHLANILKSKGAYDEAIVILQNLIKLNPQFAAAYNNLGTLYFAKNNWQEAILAYESAIHIQANYVDAYYNLGLALNKARKFPEAMNVYLALLELSPEHIGGHFHLGSLLMLQKQYQAAIDQLIQVEQSYPHHFETQSNLATCFLKLGWLVKAREHYLKASEVIPDDIQVLFNLGVIAMQQGNVKDAIKFYTRVLQIDVDNYEAQNNLAVAYLSVKNMSAALNHFNEALRIQPSNEAIKHIISLLIKDKKITNSPPEYIRSLFDSYADHYDPHILQTLNYQVPRHLFEIVKNKYDLSKVKWDILDLGCGTGLCGELFKPISHVLIGVDISQKMLEMAQQKSIYDQLNELDILSYIKEQKENFDLIVAGDVLVYFGDLASFFAAVHQALRPDGFFVFNVEIAEQEKFTLTESGRFKHSKDYLDRLVSQSHFSLIDYNQASMRTQNHVDVLGHFYLLKKE